MKRKITIGILALGVALLVGGCELNKLVDIKFTTGSFSTDMVVSPDAAGNFVEVIKLKESDIEKEIEAHGGSMKDLEKITISEISIELVSGSENLDPFGNAEIEFETIAKLNKKVAWADPIPNGVIKFIPEYTSDNLKDVLSNDAYNIIFKSNLRSALTKETTLRIRMSFDIKL